MSMLIGCLLFNGLIRAEEEPQAQFFASQAKLNSLDFVILDENDHYSY